MVNPHTRKTWTEFRTTGLLLFINQFLHIFGWVIVVEIDEGTGIVTEAYPARTIFRGFDRSSTEKAYEKVTKYMVENAAELDKEVNCE